MRIWLLAGIVALWLAMPSCTRSTVHVDPVDVNVKIAPIDITITIKIDQELDNFFAFQKEAEKKGNQPEKKSP